ncbi:hypothetical protein IGI04_001631 [Brassica rapa subsp. trilocularis]|uniref:Uncharacterized protein n=1 Tax=Brassica rapa subsp. trilocularis TaxID=1813537 RepID=A0ABQ7NT67_BRACM|nr:hypothetical protein IGI04_001631 [Brassica rapa subsp. trilocularis]
MVNKFKHSKAEQTTLASKLPSSQLNIHCNPIAGKRLHLKEHPKLFPSLKLRVTCKTEGRSSSLDHS